MKIQFNKPTYLKEELLPKLLDLTIHQANILDEAELKLYIENIRLRCIELIKKKHPPFSEGLNETEILLNLNKLNEDGKDKLSKPKLAKEILRAGNIELGDGLLKHIQNSASALNQWFFEMYESKVASGKCPLDQFYNAEQFYRNMRAIIKDNKFGILEAKPHSRLSKSLDCLRIINGSKPVYNFPPDLAKWIYLNVAKRTSVNSDEFLILDPCIGWGGRLAGALAACNHFPLNNKIVRYYGTDVNRSIFDQYEKFLRYWIENVNSKIKLKFYNAKKPAEDLLEDEFLKNYINKFDVVFTSPPYYNVEQYSMDPEQSFIRYPQYDEGVELSWKIGFLKRLISNSFEFLKPGGELWLNIANINSSSNRYKHPKIYLEDDALELAKQLGFKHIWTYKMQLKNIYNITEKQRKKGSTKKRTEFNNVLYIVDENGSEQKQIKYEPIMVFKKI